MRNPGLLIFSLLLIAACNQQQPQTPGSVQDPASTETAAPVRDGIFIHITECYDDPHRVLMPLRMATMMSDDKDVLVYMDIHSVMLLVKGAKDIQFAEFESAHTYIRQLIEKGVGIYACPSCLKIAGFKPEDLMEGIQLAQKDKFFNFTKGRIVTLDY